MTASPISATIARMAYPGGKAGAGVAQTIINQVPAHEVYIEPFLGDGAIMRRMKPAARSIGVEIDADVLDRFALTDGRPAELWNCDAVEFLRHHFGLYRRDRPPPKPATVVYCDPPYVRSTRSDPGAIYRHEMTDEQHAELLDVLLEVSRFAYVLISGYWSELYADELDAWRVVRFQTTNRAGRLVEECLWCSFPDGLPLHDHRYIGDNKRKREVYAKRARTLRRKFQRASEQERGFYREALADFL